MINWFVCIPTCVRLQLQAILLFCRLKYFKRFAFFPIFFSQLHQCEIFAALALCCRSSVGSRNWFIGTGAFSVRTQQYGEVCFFLSPFSSLRLHRSLAWITDSIFASGSHDRRIGTDGVIIRRLPFLFFLAGLWKVGQTTPVCYLDGHTQSAWELYCESPSTLYSVSPDGTLRCWTIQTRDGTVTGSEVYDGITKVTSPS